MPGQFFQRLRNYYLDVAAVLRGEAGASSIFPNSTDIGMSREHVYAEFLRQHAPSKCNVFFGGFLFGNDGSESPQLDVIITTDTTPRFDLHNRDGRGKSFSPVEGTLGVASIKSTLNRNELHDVLNGIAGIPPTSPLDNRVTFGLTIDRYDDWPYKIVYASDGITGDTLLAHLNAFYVENPNVPVTRRPNVIHVAGKYVIFRIVPGITIWNDQRGSEETPEEGTFRLFTRDPDLQALLWVLNELQQCATASNHILYEYGDMLNQVTRLTSRDAQQNVGPERR